jgi:hypothetical protein
MNFFKDGFVRPYDDSTGNNLSNPNNTRCRYQITNAISCNKIKQILTWILSSCDKKMVSWDQEEKKDP